MKRYTSLAVASALVAVALGVVAAPTQAAAKPSITVNISLAPASFAAVAGETTNRGVLYELAYDTLIYTDAKGKLQPLLATKWVYNADLTRLTLTLRKGVKFTDGAPFNAAAVVANIEAFRKSANTDVVKSASISSVRQGKDPYTVVFQLTDQDPALLSSLSSTMGMMESPRAIGTDVEQIKPVGSGAYMLSESQSTAGSRWVYVPNPKYWDPKVQTWSTITVTSIFDNTAALNALTTGQTDLTAVQHANDLSIIRNAGFATIAGGASMQALTIVDRGGKMGTPLGDLRIRQALNYAMDQNVLIKVCNLGEGATTASSVFPPSSAGYSKAVDSTYKFDVAKAKALVDAYKADKGVSEIKIPTLDFSPFMANCFAAMVQMAGDAGITLYAKNPATPSTNIYAMLSKPEWPIFWFTIPQSNVDWTLVQDLVSRDSSTWNPLSYGTSTTDGLIVKVRSTTGAAQAKALADINKYITTNAWFVPFGRGFAWFAYDAKKAKVSLAPGSQFPTYPRMVTAK